MEIVINHKLQVVEFWLKRDEKIMDIDIERIRKDYGVGKYKIVTYHSGSKNLLEETKKLILHNKAL